MHTTETAKHSPGPWRIGQEFGPKQDEIEAADGRCMAVVWTRRAFPGATARCQFEDDPELVANARLIAAAPELLDVLTQIESHLALNLACPPDLINTRLQLKKVRAAIAKATANNSGQSRDNTTPKTAEIVTDRE